MRCEKLTAILAEHKQQLKQKFHVKEIGVFGSFVRGQETKKSDIDILVEFNRPVGLFAFMDLEEYLSMILKAKKIDLVTKKALKPHIGAHILKEVIYA